MMKRWTLLSILLLAASVGNGIFPSPAMAAEGDDYWQTWRARQRSEAAALPKPPAPLPGDGSPIDRFLGTQWAKLSIKPAPVVPDRIFARRVYLDVIGLLPTIDQLECFERDQSVDKREKLVDTLLADKQAYAEHWMTFWNDLLRNDEQTNIDGLRKPITPWLYASLSENKPVDLFVA